MEILFGLVLLAVLAVSLLGFFGLTALGIGAAGAKKRAAEEPERIRQVFDGSETVVYTVTMATPPPEKVVPMAGEHGYRLVSQSGQGLGQTFVFQRVTP
jgi:hypothetical protein